MDFKFTITCSATFQSGKFAGRDDVASELQQAADYQRLDEHFGKIVLAQKKQEVPSV